MMKKNKVKIIVFDVGGVLALPHYYIKKGEKEFSGIHESIAEKIGITFDEWFDAIDVLYAQATVGTISGARFIDLVSKKLSISKKKLVHILYQTYKTHMKKNNELYRVIEKLRKKKYSVGVLTDQWYFSRESIFPKKENKFFDFVIVSYEVGMKKPDPALYRLLMKIIREKNKTFVPSDVLFIDNRAYNLIPAHKMGMKTLLFKNNRQLIRTLKRWGVGV